MAMIDRRVLFCLALLVANDWWLKDAVPSWFTGKLSDVAGLVVFAVAIATALRSFGLSTTVAGRVGASLAGLALSSVKLSAVAASFVVTTLETVTRVNHTIVVDPTDLLALVALPVAVSAVERPWPPRFRRAISSRQLRFVAFAAACVACAASSVDEGSRLGYVDVSESGQISVGRDDADGVTTVYVVDESGEIDRANAGGVVDWSLTTESCSPVEPMVCILLGPETAINESTDGGETYVEKWAIDDGGWWHFERTTEATDVAWLPDGRAFIAMQSMDPIRRSIDGEYSPSIATLHPYPGVVVGFAVLGWLIVVETAFFADRRRSVAGTTLFGLGALTALAAAVMGASKGFGALISIFVGAPIILVCMASGYTAFAIQKSLDRREGVVLDGRGRAPWWTFVWPPPVIVFAGLAWDADLVPWNLTLGLILGSFIVGWPMLWILRADDRE